MPAADATPDSLQSTSSSPRDPSRCSAVSSPNADHRSPPSQSSSALFWTILYLQFTVDDAYISFRYAKQLQSLTHVWNWNVLRHPRGGIHQRHLHGARIVPALLLHLLARGLLQAHRPRLRIATMLYRLHTAAAQAASPSSLGICCSQRSIPWVWLHAYAGLETPLYMLLILEMATCVHRANTTTPSMGLHPVPPAATHAARGHRLRLHRRRPPLLARPRYAAPKHSRLVRPHHVNPRRRLLRRPLAVLPSASYPTVLLQARARSVAQHLRGYLIFNFSDSKDYLLTC